MNKVIVALPAYNEETSLDKLLTKILMARENVSKPMDVLIVNDGSTDRTGDIINRYEEKYGFIKSIHHPENRGLGEAMKTIITYLITNCDNSDIAITFDADNTHNPKLIPAMVNKLEEQHLDVVIASRFTQGGEELGLTLARKVYSRGAEIFFKLFFPINGVRDYSCGYRAYRIDYLKKAHKIYNGKIITTQGFECMAELLARFSKIGIQAGEYPLVLEYHLKEAPSKMKVFRTIIGYLKLLFKIRRPHLERKQFE